MLDAKTLDTMAAKLAQTLPASIQATHKDIQKNLREVLAQLITKMDLVTREEYEIQLALLRHSEAKLKTLEQRVSALEKSDA